MSVRLAVCGAHGPIAQGFCERLEDADCGLATPAVFAVRDAPADALRVRGSTVPVHPIAEADFAQFDLLLIFDPEAGAETLAEAANARGCHVIDASLAGLCRGRPVVPELMAVERVDSPVFWCLPHPAISALAPVLDGLVEGNVIQSVAALVCEPASALGEEGTRQLAAETARLLNGQGVKAVPGRGQLAFNLLPSAFPEAEMWADCLRDLLGIAVADLRLQRLQVPLFYGQTVQLSVALERAPQLSELRGAWAKNNIHFVDNKGKFSPVALAEDDRIHLGQLQLETAAPHRLSVWVIADNVRKSAVVNTNKLIEILIKSSI